MQEAFLSLAAQRTWPDNVAAWLFRVVRNEATSLGRSDERRRRREAIVAESRPALFSSRPGDLMDARQAEQALAKLPPDQREAVILRIWGGMTLAQIAEQLGRPLSTVHDLYCRALATIREQMESLCRNRK